MGLFSKAVRKVLAMMGVEHTSELTYTGNGRNDQFTMPDLATAELKAQWLLDKELATAPKWLGTQEARIKWVVASKPSSFWAIA